MAVSPISDVKEEFLVRGQCRQFLGLFLKVSKIFSLILMKVYSKFAIEFSKKVRMPYIVSYTSYMTGKHEFYLFNFLIRKRLGRLYKGFFW